MLYSVLQETKVHSGKGNFTTVSTLILKFDITYKTHLQLHSAVPSQMLMLKQNTELWMKLKIKIMLIDCNSLIKGPGKEERRSFIQNEIDERKMFKDWIKSVRAVDAQICEKFWITAARIRRIVYAERWVVAYWML